MSCDPFAFSFVESSTMYQALDKFFFAFHSVLILSVVFGWIWKRTRKANLVVVLLTAFSWFGLGIWYGFGYCPCTDWHWHVRRELGDYDLPFSYIKFLIDRLTGWDADATLVNVGTVVVFAIASALSICVNVADWRKKRS